MPISHLSSFPVELCPVNEKNTCFASCVFASVSAHLCMRVNLCIYVNACVHVPVVIVHRVRLGLLLVGLTLSRSVRTSCPTTNADPNVAFTSPVSRRNKVVFPAPTQPISPKHSPARTPKVSPWKLMKKYVRVSVFKFDPFNNLMHNY